MSFPSSLEDPSHNTGGIPHPDCENGSDQGVYGGGADDEGQLHQQTYKNLFGTCTSLYKLVQACTRRESLKFVKLKSQVEIFASSLRFVPNLSWQVEKW